VDKKIIAALLYVRKNVANKSGIFSLRRSERAQRPPTSYIL